MAKYEINDTTLQSYADQIRRITVKEDKIKTIDMPQAIRNLPNPGTNYHHIILPYGVSESSGAVHYSQPIPDDIDINKITSIYVITAQIVSSSSISGTDTWKYRVSIKNIHDFNYGSDSYLLKAQSTPAAYPLSSDYYTVIDNNRRVLFNVVSSSGSISTFLPIYPEYACAIIVYSN